MKEFWNEIDNENVDIAKMILKDSETINCDNVYDEGLLDRKVENKNNKIVKFSGVNKYVAAVACMFLVVSAGFWFNQEFNNNNEIIPTYQSSKTNESELTVAKGYEDIYRRMLLASYIGNEKENAFVGFDGVVDEEMAITNDAMLNEGVNFGSSLKGNASGDDGSDKDYYNTNVQEENIDESDIVKTDGEYIYSLSVYDDQRIAITRVNGKDMKKVAEIELTNADYDISEMYVSGDKLVLIGVKYENVKGNIAFNTIVLVYDIKDRANPVIVNENIQEGSYSDSRMVGEYLYLITNHNLHEIEKECCVPKVNGKMIPYDCIYMPEQIDEAGYVVLSSLNINKSSDFENTVAVAGRNVEAYVSDNNIYLVNGMTELVNKNGSDDEIMDGIPYEDVNIKFGEKKVDVTNEDREYINEYFTDSDVDKCKKKSFKFVYEEKNSVQIIKYSYEKGNISFVAKGEVEGSVEDNLSMDEEKGYLRLVTTTNRTSVGVVDRKLLYNEEDEVIKVDDKYYFDSYAWGSEESNNVYVLDADMNVVARIGDLAKGEKIYSARFFGDYGYFVTFRQMDPLFTVDFTDMENPTIIGELKIPGFSDYLHFYDENKLLGLGYETDMNCIKLEMYDISEITPKVESKLILKKYEESMAMDNYKAAMIDSGKGYIGFPASNYDWEKGGELLYYLIYTYENDEFKELAKIKLSVFSENTRGLFIGDYIYIVTPNVGIKAINIEEYLNDGIMTELEF